MRLIIFILILAAQFVLAAPQEVTLKNYPFVGPYQATLSAQAFFSAREKFDQQGRDLEIRVLANRPELKFKMWMQEKPAPAIFLIPGFGNHFRGNTALGLANMLYRNGFTVIAVANPLNFDFSRAALTGGLPGYTPSDAQDLHRTFRLISKMLSQKYPQQILGYGVTGYSSGGLYTLFVANVETNSKEEDKVGFQSYFALNPPISPAYSMNEIDRLYLTYQKWTDAEKKANYINFVTQISALEITEREADQINIIRSLSDETLKVAIGATFRLKLSALFQVAYEDGHLDALFNKGYLTDLKGTYQTWSRQKFYNVIEQNYNFHRYIHDAIVPYYQIRHPDWTAEMMLRNSGLEAIADELRTNPKIRVLHNTDDIFMHTPESLNWLKVQLDSKLILFDKGGHVGNFYMPQVQGQIVQTMRSAFGLIDPQINQPSIYQINL